MKKIIIPIFLILICYLGYSQTFPITTNMGSVSTLNKAVGGLTAGAGAIETNYLDTASANLNNYIRNYTGAKIYTTGDSSLWYRIPNKWIKVLPSGSVTAPEAWLTQGNIISPFSPVIRLGTANAYELPIQTNGVRRLTVPVDGLKRTSDPLYKYVMIDTSGAEHYLAFGDGSSGSSTLTSIGSGYAVGVTGTNNVKSIKPYYGIVVDSTVSGEAGIRVDSTELLGQFWGTRGNTNTTAGTNFIGTTDAVPLIFKTDNTQSGILDPIDFNTGFGVYSLQYNTGSGNTAIGYGSMSLSGSGNNNTALGATSLQSVTTGQQNNAFGVNSLKVLSTGYYNTAIGNGALAQTISGSSNIGIGLGAGTYNTTQSNRLYISSIPHTNILDDTTESIIYGYQDATAANQRLYINAKTFLPYIPSGVGTKAVRINPGTGELTYADTTTSSGGTVTGTGTAGQLTKWTGTSSIGDATTGTGVLTALGVNVGSAGAFQRNNDGFNGTVGATTPSTGAFTTGSFSGQVTNTTNGAASTPPSRLTGTWFTGGTATTTKPQLLIEPTGTTSTAWSTSGTGLGINASSGFTGNLIDGQVNGVSIIRFGIAGTASGKLSLGGGDNNQISFENSGTERFNIANSNAVLTTTGAGSAGYAFKWNAPLTTDTRNDGSYFNFASNFAPTSGTVANASMRIAPTVNQTGGANGITRGLYINPTITAAADFRSLEVATGNSLFGTTSGSVGIGTTSPTSTLQVTGSLSTTYTATATSLTANATHQVIDITATGQTITLPTAVGIQGREYTVKLTASGTGTVNTTSSQTIDGATTYSLTSQYKYITVKSTNANWIIIAQN